MFIYYLTLGHVIGCYSVIYDIFYEIHITGCILYVRSGYLLYYSLYSLYPAHRKQRFSLFILFWNYYNLSISSWHKYAKYLTKYFTFSLLCSLLNKTVTFTWEWQGMTENNILKHEQGIFFTCKSHLKLSGLPFSVY